MSITFENVTVRFDTRTVLDDVTLSLTEKRIGVVGDNGSGKSTFARLVNGLLLPDEGRVTVDGYDTHADGKNLRAQVGFLFQNPDHQIVMPTVAEDLALGLKPLKLSPEKRDLRLQRCLTQFGLTELADRSAHLLSGGEKQLVALAGVMIANPSILVCDEPTTLLDRRNAAHVMKLIADLPIQVILITHHLEHLKEYERVLWFENGRVIKDDVPGEVIAEYKESVAL